MALPLRVRAVMHLQTVLTKVGALPDTDKVLAMPEAKRIAMGAPKALVGKLPSVDAQDRHVTTRDGASIRVRVYRSSEPTDQPVLYIHGGGFVVGGIDSCDHICRRLAHESGAVVVSVEYRLAPDHAFPIPVHDSADAAYWLIEHADELGVDPSKLVVGGDSAGGNLAAVLAVLFRDEGRPLAGQLLIYPTVDLSLSLPGIQTYEGVGLGLEDCRRMAVAYLGDHPPTDPYASPWYADATGLAPAFVITVDHDCLHGEGAAYAEKLRAAGVPVEHVNVADHVHGSLSLPKLFKGIDDLYAGMVAFLRQVSVSAH
ncbi:MAG: alpha/beta hydrolase [Actinomycetota bacterium]|nr:alpha/beta hydrolase [Actinomycetota bacterium]